MKVAVSHSNFTVRGGAERVVSEIARIFDAPIYTEYTNKSTIDEDLEVRELFNGGIAERLLRRSGTVGDLFRFFFSMTHWDRVPELHDFDVVIQSKDHPLWYVPSEEQTIIRYVHTPPRRIYDQFYNYGSTLKRRIFANIQRTLYLQTLPYADLYLANSELVARRCSQYWGIDKSKIKVLYPPVETSMMGSRYTADLDKFDSNDYYLTVSRIEPKKNIDLMIQCFNELGNDFQLVVAGDGPSRERLESMAGDNITFLGYVDDDTKKSLCAGAKAGLYAAENEDFGIVPIEFFASGTPVLGVADGYTQYQVIDGKNGYQFNHSKRSLLSTLEKYENKGVEWSTEEIENFADRFSKERFQDKIRELTRTAYESSDYSPEWNTNV